MKKFISILLIITTVLSVMTFTIGAQTQREQSIVVGKSAPTVDGNIDLSEGWSKPAYLNTMSMSNCWAQAPQTTEGTMHFAYTEEGLYYAADIIEDIHAVFMDGSPTDGLNSFVYSTGEDDIDRDYGYNGDIFVLAFDVERMFYNAGYNRPSSYSPWYCVGLFEEEGAKMYRQQVRNHEGDITDLVQVEGKATEKGWCFEAFIPWDVIIEDVTNATTRNPVTYSKEMLAAGDYMIYAHAIYHDRFFDPEMGEVDTWSRYATQAEYLPDGTPGEYSSGVNVASYGLTLNMTNHKLNTVTVEEPYIYDAGKMEVYCTDCGELVDSYNKSVTNNVGEFDDVKADKWYSESIRYCAKYGYMDGVGYRLFDADATLTREMFVKILFNISDDTEFSFSDDIPYTDVKADSWYEDAVGWAHLTGVTSGMSETTFGVGRAITRQELVTMLYSYSKYREYDTTVEEGDLSAYTDGDKVADWAQTAMIWAIDRGIVSGTSPDTLSPKKTAQRMEAAAIIERFAENVVAVEIADGTF